MLELTARIETFEGAGYAWLLVETLAILAVVALVAYLAVRMLSARGFRQQGPIRVLARQPLEPKRTLYLIGVGEKVWLVGASEGALTTLAELDEGAIDVLRSAEPPPDFASQLASKLRERLVRHAHAEETPAPETTSASADASSKERSASGGVR